MNTWLIEHAEAIERWKGYGRFRGPLFCIEDAKGPRVIVGDGVRITREGEQPDSRTDKPKPPAPAELAASVATEVGRKVTEELGKWAKPNTPAPNDPAARP